MTKGGHVRGVRSHFARARRSPAEADAYGAVRSPAAPLRLKLRVEVEEGVYAVPQLGFNLLARALEHVHRNVGFVAIFEHNGSFADGGDLVGG